MYVAGFSKRSGGPVEFSTVLYLYMDSRRQYRVQTSMEH
jgi:hypothetical protein